MMHQVEVKLSLGSNKNWEKRTVIYLLRQAPLFCWLKALCVCLCVCVFNIFTPLLSLSWFVKHIMHYCLTHLGHYRDTKLFVAKPRSRNWCRMIWKNEFLLLIFLYSLNYFTIFCTYKSNQNIWNYFEVENFVFGVLITGQYFAVLVPEWMRGTFEVLPPNILIRDGF